MNIDYNLYIGCTDEITFDYYGWLSDFRIYNTILPDNIIKNLYKNTYLNGYYYTIDANSYELSTTH